MTPIQDKDSGSIVLVLLATDVIVNRILNDLGARPTHVASARVESWMETSHRMLK